MVEFPEKILLTTDWHFGLNNSNLVRLNILCKVVKEIAVYAKKNKIKTIVFGGDMFHFRNQTETRVLNVAIECVDMLSRICQLYLIVGNHDIYSKNSLAINTMKVFRSNRNVKIIDKITEFSIGGKTGIMVPWLGDVKELDRKYDMAIGHFDVDTKYLIKSYIEMNRVKTQVMKKSEEEIDSDDLLREVEKKMENSKFNNLVGDFVDVVNEGGTVFAGHIHANREFIAKKRHFVFVGSPYQQTLAEAGCRTGFYVVDGNGYSFHELTDIPKFVDVKISDIVSEGIDSYDYSRLTDNIVHRIYDVEIDAVMDAKISRKISSAKPIEEVPADYDIQIKQDSEDPVDDESSELIRKSKLEYIRKYISEMDKKKLKAEAIDSKRLYGMMEEYYKAVSS